MKFISLQVHGFEGFMVRLYLHDISPSHFYVPNTVAVTPLLVYAY
jgi:hypothetical protein